MTHQDYLELIFKTGEESFSKLESFKIPPYPKYYYDTFIELLSKNKSESLEPFINKYEYLFAPFKNEKSQDLYFSLTNETIREFEETNKNLKTISGEINIVSCSKEDGELCIDSLVKAFTDFQLKILEELKRADDSIYKLKNEIDRLEKESNIDPLTKTYNRRALLKDLEEIMALAQEQNRELDMAIVMIDLDDFKHINDTYGHIAGDKTLVYIASLLFDSVRKGTKVYRYGGEEFVIFLNRTQMEEAQVISQRILHNIEKSKLYYKNNFIKITASIGLAKHKLGDTSEQILDRSDRAMYEAKKNGKNQLAVI